MPRIIECVPNFSEGRNKVVIDAIAKAISSTAGCKLLDVDPGVSTNRTVYTFVGSPEAVVDGAVNAARVAKELIDMTKHHGEHPRLGAMDVCPFIPVQGVQMSDCVKCAEECGKRLAKELSLPVYLYGEASKADYRKSVPQIRAGEYEGLQEKILKPEWKPDFVPESGELSVPSWGATMVGARKFLIAYNINVLSTKEQAHRIALNIREQGRSPTEPGRLKKTQAMGWYLEEANVAQVSVNILDFDVTSLHDVFEEIKHDATELKLAVVGSQIVGLIPLQAVLNTAEFYMKKENLFLMEEEHKIRLVIARLELNSLGNFNPQERIIDYMIGGQEEGPLVKMPVKDFILAVGSRAPAPGGGSVAALLSSLGAALSTMVGHLTYGNKKFEHLDAEMRTILPVTYKAMKDLTPLIDADTAAFDEYMAACKMPHTNPEEKKIREEKMQAGLQSAISVPLNVAEKTNAVWPTLIKLAGCSNIVCKSDLQVGSRSLETGVWGAYYNVLINAENITDAGIKSRILSAASAELKIAQDGCAQVLDILSKRNQ